MHHHQFELCYTCIMPPRSAAQHMKQAEENTMGNLSNQKESTGAVSRETLPRIRQNTKVTEFNQARHNGSTVGL